MFKAVRITLLLLVLFFVSVSTWLSQTRSTDWNNSLWVKVYPINGDDSEASRRYIEGLDVKAFKGIENFVSREIEKYGHLVNRPVRLELGNEIHEQPPALGDSPNVLDVMFWSLRLRWWSGSVTDEQDDPAPDVRIFVRYHEPIDRIMLENSVGMQKGMVGIVNAYADRRQAGSNNVIIAHEFLHTLGATDKYDPLSGLPHFPDGYAEPDRRPRYPQRYAEIMGGRISETENVAMIPKGLRYVVIGTVTAQEIRLIN